MKRIGDTYTVQKKVGERLRSARDEKGMTRKMLAEALSAHPNAPIENCKKGEISVERLKQWEYGNNPVGLEWLPAIFDVLGIDAGYLFGQYKEKNLYIAHAVETTGLSEKAASLLQTFHMNIAKDVFDMPELNRLLVSADFWEMVNRLAVYRHECGVVEHRPKVYAIAKERNDRDAANRAMSDYKFAATDKNLALFEAQQFFFKIADRIESEVKGNAVNPKKGE